MYAYSHTKGQTDIFTKMQKQYRSGGEYLLQINRVHATTVHQQLQYLVLRTLRFHIRMKQIADYHQPLTLSFIMYLCFENGKAV